MKAFFGSAKKDVPVKPGPEAAAGLKERQNDKIRN